MALCNVKVFRSAWAGHNHKVDVAPQSQRWSGSLLKLKAHMNYVLQGPKWSSGLSPFCLKCSWASKIQHPKAVGSASWKHILESFSHGSHLAGAYWFFGLGKLKNKYLGGVAVCYFAMCGKVYICLQTQRSKACINHKYFKNTSILLRALQKAE